MNLLQILKAVHQAANDCEILNKDNQWATMEVNWLDTAQPKVLVHYGTIHSNGQREVAIATRHYYVRDDKVDYYIQGHP